MENMKGTFHVTCGIPGYGNRVWVLFKEDFNADGSCPSQQLNMLSMWGGPDKASAKEGSGRAWEMENRAAESTTALLVSAGYKRITGNQIQEFFLAWNTREKEP